MENNICCFTGLRTQKLNMQQVKNNMIMQKCEKLTIQLIEKYIVDTFISGMALGWDTWCAQLILNLKKRYPNIVLECALPCKNQEKYWNKFAQQQYSNIIE